MGDKQTGRCMVEVPPAAGQQDGKLIGLRSNGGVYYVPASTWWHWVEGCFDADSPKMKAWPRDVLTGKVYSSAQHGSLHT